MLVYKAKMGIRVVVYIILTLLSISILYYLGYNEIRPYIIVIMISIILFFLFETENSYNIYIDKSTISVDSTILFWRPVVNFKINEIDIVRFGRGTRNESFIIITYHSGRYKYGVQGLTRADAEQISEYLKLNGCPLVLNLL